MGHTYIHSAFHCIFATRERRPYLNDDMRPRLADYMVGIARKNKMQAVAVGGYRDHMHLCLEIPADLALARAMQLIKGGSSKWIHEMFPELRGMSWQDGYAGFSVSESLQPRVVEYIEGQAEHHAKHSFEDEFIAFLKKHHIEYDPRFVLG
jgi:putative transposase